MIQPAYRPWFEKYPTRFAEESSILGEYGFELDHAMLQEQRVVYFTGRQNIDCEREVHVVFPDTFPSLPPRVFDTADSPLLPRHHAPNTRQFCLFGPGNARWTAALSSHHIMEELKALLSIFGSATPLLVDDHAPEPVSATLDYLTGEAVFVPPAITRISLSGQQLVKGEFSMRYAPKNRNPRSGRGVVTTAYLDSEKFEAEEAYLDVLEQTGQPVKGTLMVLSSAPTLDMLSNLVKGSVKPDPKGLKKAVKWFAFVFPEESGTASALRDSWVFARHEPGRGYGFVRGCVYNPAERMARIPGLQTIQETTVAVVGCGCLGSKIAVNLAASGVGRLALVDGEVMEPMNSVRHEVGVDGFGIFKVDALARRLRQLNPECTFDLFPGHCIGWHNAASDEQKFCEMLSSVSLIVDATGVHGISRLLNEQSYECRVPAVYASVTNGAWGGEIVRCVPSKGACWMCWSEQFATGAPPAEPSAAIYPPGCNQPSFSGTTYDAAVVASFATSMVIDTLIARVTGTYSYKSDYIRWSGRNQEGPLLLAEQFAIERRSHCPFCGEP